MFGGTWLIVGKSKVWREINHIIEVKGGAFTENLLMTKVNYDERKVKVTCVDAMTGRGIQNCYLELNKEQVIAPEEGITQANGSANFHIKQTGIHQIRTKAVGYVPFTKTINYTKGFLKMHPETEVYNITIPLMPIEGLEQDV